MRKQRSVANGFVSEKLAPAVMNMLLGISAHNVKDAIQRPRSRWQLKCP